MADVGYFISKEEVTCAICLESWMENDPRLLGCLHTFCLDCLRSLRIENFQLICPQCRQKCSIPLGNVENLKRHPIKSSIQVPRILSITCKDHGKESSVYCETHSIENLCVVCWTESHSKCKVYPMVRFDRKKEIVKSLVHGEAKNEEEILASICERELKAIGQVQQQFHAIRMKLKKAIEERKTLWNTICSNNKLLENIPEDVSILQIEKPTLSLSEKIKINCRIEQNSKFINNFIVGHWTDMEKGQQTKIERFEIKQNRQSTRKGNRKELQDLFNSLQSTEQLVNINFNKCNLRIDDCKIIERLLQNQTQIEKIILAGNEQMGSGLSNICQGLVYSSKTLLNVNFQTCNLDANGCKSIGSLLKKCSNIERISLGWNVNMGCGLAYICQGLLQSANSLRFVHLQMCNLNSVECRVIGNFLRNCSNIEKISFIGNKKMGMGLFNICRGLLQSANTLKYLDFEMCKLNEIQCIYIGNLLRGCSNIEKIILKDNVNIENGMFNICQGLLVSADALKYVNLQRCNLNEHQCQAIGSLLRNCSKIEQILLGWNTHMGNGLSEICSGLLQSANSLTHINFECCNLDENQCRWIGKLLENCTKVETFILRGNENMGSGLLDICQGFIKLAPCLKYVNFQMCALHKGLCSTITELLEKYAKVKI